MTALARFEAPGHETRPGTKGGGGPLILHIPTLAEVGGLQADNEIELGQHIRTVLRLLRPKRALGMAKRRFGRRHDGGYVHLDDFDGVDTALSLGINDDVSWDCDVADRGVKIYQFDHTVEDPRPRDERMVFAKTMIAGHAAPGCETLEALVSRHDRRAAKPNLILKMDIEGSEWPVIEETSDATFGRFAQVACELHSFERFRELPWRQGFYRALRKISLSHGVVHVHANNYAGFQIIAGVPVASVLEISWANRSAYDLVETDELFPTDLDDPCHSAAPDHYLGAFLY